MSQTLHQLARNRLLGMRLGLAPWQWGKGASPHPHRHPHAQPNTSGWELSFPSPLIAYLKKNPNLQLERNVSIGVKEPVYNRTAKSAPPCSLKPVIDGKQESDSVCNKQYIRRTVHTQDGKWLMFVILYKDDCLALSFDISVFLQSSPKGGGCLFFVLQERQGTFFRYFLLTGFPHEFQTLNNFRLIGRNNSEPKPFFSQMLMLIYK